MKVLLSLVIGLMSVTAFASESIVIDREALDFNIGNRVRFMTDGETVSVRLGWKRKVPGCFTSVAGTTTNTAGGLAFPCYETEAETVVLPLTIVDGEILYTHADGSTTVCGAIESRPNRLIRSRREVLRMDVNSCRVQGFNRGSISVAKFIVE